MKKKLSILLLFIVSITMTIGQNLKALDDKNGFRDYKFGDSLSKFTNLNLVDASKDSTTRFYTKTDDKLKIGENDVVIAYVFFKGQLSTVVIKTKGYSNSRGVLKTLEELYGKGDQSNQYIEKYYWFGGVVTASYNENSVTNDATVYIRSKKFSELSKQNDEENTKKAKGDM